MSWPRYSARGGRTAGNRWRDPEGLAGGKRSSAMYSLSAICRLSTPLAVSIFGANVAVAETTTVGAVDKVQAHVDATQLGQTRAVVINSDVYFRDRCHSGEGARLQATLKDGTQLTLGENATLVVERDGFEPEVWIAVLPTAQSETPVPPKSATRDFGPGGGSAFAIRCLRCRAFPHCRTPRLDPVTAARRQRRVLATAT